VGLENQEIESLSNELSSLYLRAIENQKEEQNKVIGQIQAQDEKRSPLGDVPVVILKDLFD